MFETNVFLTELNQTHSEPNQSFFKNQTKTEIKKSIPHIPTANRHLWRVFTKWGLCRRFKSGAAGVYMRQGGGLVILS